MPFADIFEQESPKQLLRAALRSGQVPGAFLFHGPWGVGKTRTALVLARALNCETREDDACDACPSCRRALRSLHRDIQFIFPLPGGKPEEVETEENDARNAYLADPYHVLQFDRFASISIDKVRELKRLATLTHAEGRHKVFVLREADRMLEVQQNALLKLLEEPPPDTHLVLTSSRPQSLLSTIVSRCQAVAFGPLASETIARVLERERGLEPARAVLAAGMADGSLGQALLLAADGGEEVGRLRGLVLAVLGAAESGGPEIHRLAQEIGGGKDRTLVRRLAHGLALWHGDLLRVRAGGAAERLVNRDLRGALEAEASRLAVAEIRRRIGLCEELIQAVDSNANLTLAVYWLLVSLGDPEAAQIGLQRDRGG